jgi:putative transposase
VAENLLLKQQRLVACRSRQRAPRLSALDRLTVWRVVAVPEYTAYFSGRRPPKACYVASISRRLVQRKYHQLFTPRTRAKRGPKGPSQELIHVIVEMKRRNPRFGCPRIAQQIAYTFGIEIDKDVVRRVLAKHYHPGGGTGPSWLTVIGHAKDSLPLSHPFVERLIGTLRREFLDDVLFWNATDLQRKLDSFQTFYNTERVHASRDS